jgi:hypothetical protein
VRPGSAAGGAPAHARHRRPDTDRDGECRGGAAWRAACFGWLTAAGSSIILTALVSAAGIAVDAAATPPQVGFADGAALLLVHLVAYGLGGYGAGRTSRATGAAQGVAVWLCAAAAAGVAATAGALFGAEFDVLARLNGFPRIPVNEDLSAGLLVAIVLSAAVALVGAVAGSRVAGAQARAAEPAR